MRVVRANDAAELQSERIEGIGRWFATGADERAEVELDASEDARIRLGPSTQLWALERGSLLFVSGRLKVQVSAGAARPGRRALRLATAQGTLYVPAATEFWVASRGRSTGAGALRALIVVRLLQGSVELLRLQQEHLQRDALSAGQERFGPLPFEVATSATDEEAVAALHKGLREGRDQPVLVGAERALEERRAAWAVVRERGDRLLARVSPSHAQKLGDAGADWKPQRPEDVRTYQRELANYSQAKHTLGELLLSAAEQSLLATLMNCPAPRAGAAACQGLERWRGLSEFP